MDSERTISFSLSTFSNALKNHWLVAGLTLFATLALAVLAMIFLPRQYRSDAMIFVRLGRETVSLDPTATTGSTISVLESRDNEINSIRDMLYSRGIIEKIVDRIGPEIILGDEDLEPDHENRDEVAASEKDYRNSPRQKAIMLLEDNTDVISSRKSSVLVLVAKAASPELAQQILNEYLDIYQTMHAVAHQTPKSNKFFEEQSKLLQSQWQETMQALQVAKEDAGVVSIEGARENLKEQTNVVQSRSMQVESSLMATQALIKKFNTVIEQNPVDRQRIREEYLAATGELSALTAEKEALDSQTRELLKRSAKLNRDEVTIGQLEQEVSLAATNFSQYEELLEQTRIEEALRNNRFTNVRVVQEPSFVPKSVSPKKKLIAAAGLVAGTTGAVLVALFFELFLIPNRRIANQQQSESENSVDLETEVLENNEFLAESATQNLIDHNTVDSTNG
jgi:uncharacterized protein involved in exopolysaccharide biosynthesis